MEILRISESKLICPFVIIRTYYLIGFMVSALTEGVVRTCFGQAGMVLVNKTKIEIINNISKLRL